MGGKQDLAESKAKIMAYKLGKPRTYTPTHIFPVTVTYVEPKPKVAKPKARRSYVKTVTEQRALQTVRATVEVRVCSCGNTIGRYSVRCVACANKLKRKAVLAGTVCPKCKGRKSKQAKHCRNCQEPRVRNEALYICPVCNGPKHHSAKVCKDCYKNA